MINQCYFFVYYLLHTQIRFFLFLLYLTSYVISFCFYFIILIFLPLLLLFSFKRLKEQEMNTTEASLKVEVEQLEGEVAAVENASLSLSNLKTKYVRT